MTGVAVKITVVPEQTGLASATIETETGNGVVIVIVIALLVAGLPETQERLEVSTQVIMSPLTGT